MGDPHDEPERSSPASSRESRSPKASESRRPAMDRETDAAAKVGDSQKSPHPGPKALKEIRVAGKGLRKPVTWLVGIIITALITGVVGQVTDGWFSSHRHADIGEGPTQVRLMQPFSATGKLLPPYKVNSIAHGGSCINSYESSDPDALRCFSSNEVADPCWSYTTRVVCLGSPWDADALSIINPTITAKPRQSIGPVPWALEIKNPNNSQQFLDCGFAGGTAAEIVAGLRANWDCFRQGQENPRGFAGYALGTPKTKTSQWTVFYAPKNSSQALEAKIIIAWR